MKFSLKPIFRKSKRSRPVSSFDPSSFNSDSSSWSDSSIIAKLETPKSILQLPSKSRRQYDTISAYRWDVMEVFKLLDKDGDGKITWKELEQVLSRIGSEPLATEEVEMMVTEADRDGDGCISLEEFDALISALWPACGAEELRDAFGLFDVDGDGKISAEELMRMLTKLGDEDYTLEDCRRMIAGVDKNEDGFVCFDDFVKMMEGGILS